MGEIRVWTRIMMILMKESEGEEWLQNNYLDIYGADRNIETLKKKW
jgi:hypothetical protein